ncbi:hypothetical protein FOCC_FOCC010894 [Frankliniella occidentalis]|nr:hypothetical protein FOCC_FOCC010894 [Frankliniella occidentalis]
MAGGDTTGAGRALRYRYSHLHRVHGAGRRAFKNSRPLFRRLQLRYCRHGRTHYLQPRIRRAHEPRPLAHRHDPGQAISAHVVYLHHLPVPGRRTWILHSLRYHTVQRFRHKPRQADAKLVLQCTQPNAVRQPAVLVRIHFLCPAQFARLRCLGQKKPGQARLSISAIRFGSLRHRIWRRPLALPLSGTIGTIIGSIGSLQCWRTSWLLPSTGSFSQSPSPSPLNKEIYRTPEREVPKLNSHGHIAPDQTTHLMLSHDKGGFCDNSTMLINIV